MATRKKIEPPAAYVFPPESCGACKFFHNFDGDTCCLALPSHVSIGDDQGENWYQRGVPCEQQDPTCIYFKFRENA